LTRSQALREAVRRYLAVMRSLPAPEEPLPDEIEALRELKRSLLAAADGGGAPCCMTWTVVLSNRAERALARVPARDRQRITLTLLNMEQEPLSGDVIPLKGPYHGSYRRRVGSWRIVFTRNWNSQLLGWRISRAAPRRRIEPG
jgi:mRNA-degrading endonuclease RelE of RelBE toxin-antitoxin system